MFPAFLQEDFIRDCFVFQCCISSKLQELYFFFPKDNKTKSPPFNSSVYLTMTAVFLLSSTSTAEWIQRSHRSHDVSFPSRSWIWWLHSRSGEGGWRCLSGRILWVRVGHQPERRPHHQRPWLPHLLLLIPGGHGPRHQLGTHRCPAHLQIKSVMVFSVQFACHREFLFSLWNELYNFLCGSGRSFPKTTDAIRKPVLQTGFFSTLSTSHYVLCLHCVCMFSQVPSQRKA